MKITPNSLKPLLQTPIATSHPARSVTRNLADYPAPNLSNSPSPFFFLGAKQKSYTRASDKRINVPR